MSIFSITVQCKVMVISLEHYKCCSVEYLVSVNSTTTSQVHFCFTWTKDDLLFLILYPSYTVVFSLQLEHCFAWLFTHNLYHHQAQSPLAKYNTWQHTHYAFLSLNKFTRVSAKNPVSCVFSETYLNLF